MTCKCTLTCNRCGCKMELVTYNKRHPEDPITCQSCGQMVTTDDRTRLISMMEMARRVEDHLTAIEGTEETPGFDLLVEIF